MCYCTIVVTIYCVWACYVASSMNLKPKCVCADCSFSTLVFMDMFAAFYYYCDRVLLLSGDAEMNPCSCKSGPACNAIIHN